MRQFDLPEMEESAPVEKAIEAVIRGRISGMVAVKPGHARLLDYDALLHGWQSGAKSLAEVPGGVVVKPVHPPPWTIRPGPGRYRAYQSGGGGSPVVDLAGPNDDFALLSSGGGKATIRSRMEPLADRYLAQSAGYCCTGPDEHCYPPYARGTDDGCVVPFCPGTLP